MDGIISYQFFCVVSHKHGRSIYKVMLVQIVACGRLRLSSCPGDSNATALSGVNRVFT